MTHHPIAAGKSSFDLVDHEALFNSLPLEDGSTFLDVACGTGRYAAKVARLIGSGIVYAVDLWADGIVTLIEELANQQITNVWATVADATQGLPLATDSVDVCLLATVLHDFNQEKSADAVLNQIVRVLKPDGCLAVVEFKMIEPPPGPPLAVRLTAEQVDRMLAPFGFQEAVVCDLGPRLYLARYRIEK